MKTLICTETALSESIERLVAQIMGIGQLKTWAERERRTRLLNKIERLRLKRRLVRDRLRALAGG